MSEHDPRSLPLLAAAASTPTKPGRRRGTFSLRSAEEPTGTSVNPQEGLQPRARRVIEGDINWGLVAELRGKVAQRMAADTTTDSDREMVGRAKMIQEVLSEQVEKAVSSGKDVWTTPHEEQLARAVFDSVFRMGRFQPLLDNDDVETIIVTGSRVFTERTDGSLVPEDPVADSDEELISWLQFIAANQPRPRQFSETEKRLHLNLPGARLFAVAWVTAHPTVIIRRHRLVNITLQDLVARGSMSPTVASFLAAAMAARRSIVVSGQQKAGKTTLLRALAAELPPEVQIATIETEFELYLHDMGEAHLIVHAFESNPGSGEVSADGRRAGAYSLADALEDSLRANVEYTIVGEVRGGEVLPMFRAMQSGSGSLSTTHAASATGAIRKLVSCALEAGPQVNEKYALNVISQDIHLIVQLDVESKPRAGGGWTKRRWVSEIIAIDPGEDNKGYSATTVFSAPRGTYEAVPDVWPDYLNSLSHYGFDLATFHAPLRRVVP